MKNKQYINSRNINRDSGEFPLLILDIDMQKRSLQQPAFHEMHWHEDFQFIYVFSGEMYFHMPGETVVCRKGEGIFTNKNVIHRSTGSPSHHYKVFRFPEHLISFYRGSPAAKTVRRISECEQLSHILLSPDIEWQKNILIRLAEISKLESSKSENTPSGLYEYEILTELAEIWREMTKNTAVPESFIKNETTNRMRVFLKYIEQHFADNISLDELAKAANVSKSECLRCFRQTLCLPPYKYIIEYRLSKAASLLAESDLPICSIAENVGFNHPSHFGKLFKEKTGYSPKDYRREQQLHPLNNKPLAVSKAFT